MCSTRMLDTKCARVVFTLLSLSAIWNVSAGERTPGIPYSHATVSQCLRDGKPDVMLTLTREHNCDELYPHLEIDIRRLPISEERSLAIGSDKLAFRCVKANDPCEQAKSGEIVFQQIEEVAKKGSTWRGHYKLRFRGNEVEEGDFQGDCYGACS